MKPVFELNKQYNFYKIACPEGFYIIDDRKDFYAFKEAYAPITVDQSKYRCITDEEYEQLKEQADNDSI